MMDGMMKKKLMIIALYLTFIPLILFSKEVYSEELSEEVQIYKFPEIKPEYSFKLGYRFTNVKGSLRPCKFEYLHDSISLGGEYIAFPFPHRLYLEVDVLNKKDYFGDIRYAYKDMVLSRWLRRILYHNLDNITLKDLNAGTPDDNNDDSKDPDVDVRDSGEKYGVRADIDTVFLRFKTPDFPFHVYIDSRFIHKKGSSQQIFLGGSGYFSRIIRVSEKRNVDWRANDVTVGANSHLGPLELDFSHTEKRFEVEAGRLMEYNYSPGTSGRAAGIYPHNLIPDTKGSTNTLKLHTSHTGRLTAGTTLSWADRENNTSGAKADYFVGAGEVMWMPLTRLTVFIKYRHRESEINNPDTLPAGYLGYSSYTTELRGIRNSISTKTDNISWIIRYRVIPKVTLHLKYSYDQYERDKGQLQEWDNKAKDTMQKNTLNLTADAKPSKELKLKAIYEHQEIDSPAHNTYPSRSDRGSISVVWNPNNRVNAFFNHEITKEKRTDIHYVHLSSTGYSSAPNNRDARKSKIAGILTLLLPANVTLTTGYCYMSSEIKQDLVYHEADASNDQVDRNATYKDSTNNYTVNLTYLPTKRLDLTGGVNITNSRAEFSPNLQVAGDPVSIAGFSKLKIREIEYTLSGGYDIKRGWKAELRYKYSEFDDLIENPDNHELKDGIAQVVFLTISKRW